MTVKMSYKASATAEARLLSSGRHSYLNDTDEVSVGTGEAMSAGGGKDAKGHAPLRSVILVVKQVLKLPIWAALEVNQINLEDKRQHVRRLNEELSEDESMHDLQT